MYNAVVLESVKQAKEISMKTSIGIVLGAAVFAALLNTTYAQFAPARVTPSGGSYVLSWAVQREGGGRGFVMAGLHTHKNLAIDSNRRLVNGNLWAAHVEVPGGGMKCELPDEVMN